VQNLLTSCKKMFFNKAGFFVFALTTVSSFPIESYAQMDMAQQPVLVITNKAMPATAPMPTMPVGPVRAPEITAAQVMNNTMFGAGTTMVGQKIDGINKDVLSLQNRLGQLAGKLNSIEGEGRNLAAGYYASVATINTQLQTGTTPGNPRLVQKLDTAQNNLEMLSDNVADLNTLAIEIADAASRASYLLDTTRMTYNLSGALEEDHMRLAGMEDQVNASIVNVDRLLNQVNDDISRTSAYLGTERNNLRTLALGVTNGDLYGRNLSNYPFSQAPLSPLAQQASFNPQQANGFMGQQPMQPMAAAPVAAPSAPMNARPLAKIRFDKSNVDYQQPVYAAVQDAMTRYPNARFELIAVHPTTGNAAQQAIESTRARRNAEKVLRTLTQFGVPLEQIDMSYAPSPEARTSEVHLFLRS